MGNEELWGVKDKCFIILIMIRTSEKENKNKIK